MKRVFVYMLYMSSLMTCVKAQTDHFLIGVYSYSLDGGSSDYHAGIQTNIGNSVEFISLFKEYNFNTIQVEFQLMPYYNPNFYIFASSSPSKAFLDRADSLGMRVILSCPDLYINKRDTTYYHDSLYSQYNHTNSINGLNYYANHPALIGFSVCDEPRPYHFLDIKRYFNNIEGYNSDLLRLANLYATYAGDTALGYPGIGEVNAYTRYVEDYITITNPNIISFDSYPIYSHNSYADETTSWPWSYFFNMDYIAKIAANHNIPYVYIPTFLRYKDNTGVDTKNINELRYVIYSALIHGAKGLNYWHAGANYPVWSMLDVSAKFLLKTTHKLILEHENTLLSLNYKNSYHVSNASNLESCPNCNEYIPSYMQWSQFPNDTYSQQIFDVNNAIIPFSGSTIDSLMVSYLSDNNGAKYFWIGNKSLVSTEQIQLNLNDNCSLVNVLEDEKCPQNGSVTVELLPGEAKLFRAFIQSENDSIISDTRWFQHRVLNGDLIVDSLATLTITDTLFCTPAARIIVRPGGKLIVDGGTLTSACAGEMWQGVYVEGHRDQPQTAANQGTVQLINGTVVENAIKGVRTSAPGSGWNTTGGIITADSATFRNCARAVDYQPYTDTNYAGQVIDNKGAFHNCTFTINDNNLFTSNSTDFGQHVSLWDVKGVEFTHCRFEDARTGNHSRKSAISALDAGFEMKTGCSYNVPRPECDCPPASSTHNSFAGFGTAIDAGTSGSPYEITIDGAQFSDNITGVRIGGSGHATVTRCQFDLSDMPVRVVSGLCLDGCTGYLVEENTFTRGASAPNGSRYGIRVGNSGTDANGLYRNTFERLSHGMYVTGTNGDGNSNTGLQMTCNGFTDNTYGIYVASGATVGPLQGSSGKGADNTFSGTQTSSLYNAGSQALTYLYSPGTSHVPYNPTTGNVTLNGTVPSNNCASTLCSNGGGTPNPKSPTPSFLALKQQYENLMADFDRNGYADLLSTAIPPQSGGTPNVNQETIEAAQYASQQINSIASELFAQSHERVRALMNDSLEDILAVRDWLDATPGLASRYLASEAEFATDGSNLLLADIANHIATSEERDEYDNYLAFYSLKEALRYGNGHVAWTDATDAQIGELIRIADANTGRSSLLAKNVLCFFFGICYDDTETRALETTTIPPTAEPPTLTESRMKAESPTLTGQQNITVHPNPTNDILHVTVTDGDAKIAHIEMFDMFGRNMAVRANNHSPQQTTVNTSDIPSGLYLLRVTLTDGTVQNIKVARK